MINMLNFYYIKNYTGYINLSVNDFTIAGGSI